MHKDNGIAKWKGELPLFYRTASNIWPNSLIDWINQRVSMYKYARMCIVNSVKKASHIHIQNIHRKINKFAFELIDFRNPNNTNKLKE